MNIRAVRCVLNEMVSTDAKHAKVEAIKISLNDIATCVENDNKNHFQISDDGNKIRATFAHSISTVDYKKVFEEITDENMTCVYSITDKQNHMTIERKGIDLPPNKQYFFLSETPGEKCMAYIPIKTKEAMADGIKFYRVANGLIASVGLNGVLDPKYFLKGKAIRNENNKNII